MGLAFDRTALRLGQLVHRRSHTKVGSFLRWGMNKWIKRICKELKCPVEEVWGNHDGIITQRRIDNRWGVGEATKSGSVVTLLEEYERDMNDGTCEVRIFEPVDGLGNGVGANASMNWHLEVKGTPYDYMAYFRLMIKSLFFDVWSKAAGWEWANWCTEGMDRSFRPNPPGIDLYQTRNPTPLTSEQVAGILPMKPGKVVTLKEVTVQVIVTI